MKDFFNREKLVLIDISVSKVFSPDMAKLSSEKIVQDTNHRWRSSLCSKEDMTRPVIEVGRGEPFSFLSALVLVPSTSTSSASQHP
jgi:hypothetical protein